MTLPRTMLEVMKGLEARNVRVFHSEVPIPLKSPESLQLLAHCMHKVYVPQLTMVSCALQPNYWWGNMADEFMEYAYIQVLLLVYNWYRTALTWQCLYTSTDAGSWLHAPAGWVEVSLGLCASAHDQSAKRLSGWGWQACLHGDPAP